MKIYFALLSPLIFFFGNLIQNQAQNQSKSLILEDIHWMIERSETDKVRAEFQKMCQENHFPSVIKGLKDGQYKGATPADDYGYQHVVVFEMQHGKMISIDYDEIHSDGHAKQHNEAYCRLMLQSGTSPAIAYPKYENETLSTQDFNQIDAVSGATYSLYRFRLSILYAIMNSDQL